MPRRAILIAGILVLAVSRMRGQPVPLDVLLDRAGRYVTEFVDRLSNVVAEETYTQNVVAISGARLGSGPQRRELKSDFLLVRTADVADWVPFRDVFEVDGKLLRDRQQRLARLFLDPSSASILRARQIAEESSRYNIGNILRTINNPVLSLAFLQPAMRHRFEFTLGKPDAGAGANVFVVSYRERGRPSVIRGAFDQDMPTHGRFWIEADSGTVVRSELAVDDARLRTVITTSFKIDERFQISVPVEFREDYQMASSRVTGTAKYGRFRRFDVTAGETMKKPAQTITEPRTGMTLVEIVPGTFVMGSSPEEAGRNADESAHEVSITRPFFLGRFEVTQAEWHKVMGANPSRFADCPACPVENVSFADIEAFLAKLNTGRADVRYRLPTEAEWEYACRAGTTTPFATGAALTTDEANYNGNFPYARADQGQFRERTTPVGSFPSNAWGLGDMHGNVWEWTSDWYGAYAAESAIDPKGAASGDTRVIRGGSWYFDGNSARCALRYTHAPQDKGFSLGFRLAAERGR